MLFKVMLCVLLFMDHIKACETPDTSLDCVALKTPHLLAFPRSPNYYQIGFIELQEKWTKTSLLESPFTLDDAGKTASTFVQDDYVQIVRTNNVDENSIYTLHSNGVHLWKNNVHTGNHAAFSYIPEKGILCTGGNENGRTTATSTLIHSDGTIQPLPTMVEGREQHHCLFDDDHGRWMVFGGFHTDYSSVKTVQSFDPRENIWHVPSLNEDVQEILSYFGGSVVHAYGTKYILTGGFSQEDGNKPIPEAKIREEQYLFDLSNVSIQELPNKCFHLHQRCDGISLGTDYGVYSWGESKKLQIFDKKTGEHKQFGWIDSSYDYNALLLDITGTPLDHTLGPLTEERNASE